MGHITPLIALGLPTWGKVSTDWARAYRHLGAPLGSTMVEFEIKDTPIAEARNYLLQQAIDVGADYLFMVGDDVLAPGDAIISLLQRMWDNPDVHLATGIYWTKSWPTQPYIWRGLQRGPYLDWTLGEWFPVDFAGCDCLLIRLSPEIKALGPEWFSTSWLWEPEQPRPSELATEDFYFYTRCREQGLTLWCDSNVQCLHEDRQSGIKWGLIEEMPQAGGIPPVLPAPGTGEPVVMVADLGSGAHTPYFGDPAQVKVLRFDGDERVRPDYRCDLRKLPAADATFDVVWSRHALEHFGRYEVVPVLREWTRILREGGELRLCVPSVLAACRQIIAIEEGTAEPDHYPWWQLYGGQRDALDVHKNGFTPRRLKGLLEMVGCLADIEVTEGDDGVNLYATAKRTALPDPYSLSSAWYAIERQEGKEMPGLRRDAGIEDVTNLVTGSVQPRTVAGPVVLEGEPEHRNGAVTVEV